MQPRDDLDEMRLVLGRDEPVADEELDHDCEHSSQIRQRVTARIVGGGSVKEEGGECRGETYRWHN